MKHAIRMFAFSIYLAISAGGAQIQNKLKFYGTGLRKKAFSEDLTHSLTSPPSGQQL